MIKNRLLVTFVVMSFFSAVNCFADLGVMIFPLHWKNGVIDSKVYYRTDRSDAPILIDVPTRVPMEGHTCLEVICEVEFKVYYYNQFSIESVSKRLVLERDNLRNFLYDKNCSITPILDRSESIVFNLKSKFFNVYS